MTTPLTTAFVFELRRLSNPLRWLAALAIGVVIGVFAQEQLFYCQAIMGGSLEGTVAADLFYASLNASESACLCYPLACLVLCEDVVSRDTTSGMWLLLKAKGRGPKALAFGKIFAVLICCLVFVAVECVALALFDVAVYGSSFVSAGIPEWLAYSGNADDYLLPSPSFCSLIPDAWNYVVVTLGLVIVEGCICASVVLFFASLFGFCGVRHLPLLVAGATLLVIYEFPSVYQNLVLTFFPDQAAQGVNNTGVGLDRLCLSSYALGAGLFQTRVGGPALVAQEMANMAAATAESGIRFEASEASLAALAQGYHVNSFASLVLIMFVLLAVASACLLWHTRPQRSRQGGHAVTRAQDFSAEGGR